MKAILTTGAPAPIGPYNQAIRAGDYLFCSGQIPLDPLTGEIVGGADVALQAVQVMTNIAAVLGAAGANFAHVVKSTIFLIDMSDFARVNDVYGARFASGPAPARSTVAVAALPRGVRIEIEVIAYLPDRA